MLILNKDKNVIKEHKVIKIFLAKKRNKTPKYITKNVLNKKHKNISAFINTELVEENGILKLRNGGFAKIFSTEAIDLSLSSNAKKEQFFNQLKYLFQIKELNLRIYKFDDKMNLNANKDYYSYLLKKYSNDSQKQEFLKDRLERFEILEKRKLTTTSRYYFVLINENKKILDKVSEEFSIQCSNTSPKLNIKLITNKLEIYQFLVNFYFSSASLEQLMWCDLMELLSPYYVCENLNMIKADNEEIQMITIKRIPPFVQELFFEELFNLSNTKCCIHVKDTISSDELIKRLDNNYEFLLSERTTTRKLSDATQMDLEKDNFQALMAQIRNNDEKIKEVDFIIAISGTRKEREETFKELKKIADVYHIKLDVPRMRQMEAWQSFDINKNGFEDYHNYLPTLTLASSFPLTITYFNDATGYLMGTDIHTALPTIFDIFHKDSTRTSSNLAIIASTGGGKSYTLKKMIVNEINRGNKCFLFDADGEYEKLVKNNNGEYIDMYSSTNKIINPLQVRFIPTEFDVEENNSNGLLDYEDCPLAKHLSYLETFIKCAFEEITESEVVVMLDMIEKLYNRFGITKNTKISSLEKLENIDYPIFSDLIDFLPDYKKMIVNPEKLKIIDSLEILLERFLVGTDAILFNNYTTVDLDVDLIAFNVKDLIYSNNKRLITTQLVNLLTYLNNIIVKNRHMNEKSDVKNDFKNIIIVVDEFHLYLKNTTKEVLLAFEQVARRIRKYHGAFIPATQSIHDFLGDNDLVRSATAIFNNCQYQLVGMLQEEDLSTYLKLFHQNPLTDTQKEFLIQAEMGEFLLSINSKNRIRLKVMASPLEVDLMGEVL